jgi:hypothetical protein
MLALTEDVKGGWLLDGRALVCATRPAGDATAPRRCCRDGPFGLISNPGGQRKSARPGDLVGRRLDRSTSPPALPREEETAREEQPDIVVSWVAWGLSEAQYWVSSVAYSPLRRRWKARGRAPLYFNYAYAALWAALLADLIVLDAGLPGFVVAAAIIASYRFIEIAVWYLKLLFDCTHRLILSPERNLLFLTIDSIATVVIVGLWLAAVPGDGARGIPEWKGALETFTLNGTPEAFSGWESDVAMLFGTLGGLLLIGAGLAVVVGLVSKRFAFGTADSYTGPVRLPRPDKRDAS